MVYRGKLSRALNPLFAGDPMSGRGAQPFGGRFNPRGVAAICTSLSPLTALKEANQVGSLQPTTLVSYEAEIDAVADGRHPGLLEQHRLDHAALGNPSWRDDMKASGEALTQAFARRLIEAGYKALLVRSFAPGTTATDLTLSYGGGTRRARHASC